MAAMNSNQAGFNIGPDDERFASYILQCIEDGNISDFDQASDDEDDEENIIINEPNPVEIAVEEQPDPVDDANEETNQIDDFTIGEDANLFESLNLTKKKDVRWRHRPFVSCNLNYQPPTDSEVLIQPLEPLDYFYRYIPKSLFESMVNFTNMYALQSGDTNFQPTNCKELEILFGLHIMKGIINLPRINLYWNKVLQIDFFCSNMTKNRFFKLRNYLHLVNNLEVSQDNTDKMFKVRPIYDSVRNRCKALTLEEKLAIDEQMVPFKGTFCLKQYMKGKPYKWGLKIYLLCGESGLCYDFVIFQGAATEIDKNLTNTFGHSGGVVMHLSERIVSNGTQDHQLYFDNYFNSYVLLQALKRKHIAAAGTARLNRFCLPPFCSDNIIKKKERGFMQEVCSLDGDVVCVKWSDTRIVSLASNFVGVGNTDSVQRWNKKEKTYEEVSRPEIVQKYNKSMGGVDKIDFLIGLYRTFIRSRKWTLRMIFHAVDLAVVNSWLEYRRDVNICKVQKKDVLDLMNFRIAIADGLVNVGRMNPSRKRGRPSIEVEEDVPQNKILKYETRPSSLVRKDSIDHLPVHCGKKEAGRCKKPNCKGKSHFRCEKCQIYLCLSKDRNCFREFHLNK